MKSIIYKLTVIALLLFSSCERFIDQPPMDQISTNDYWKTANDLKNYTLQYYGSYFTGTGMVSNDAGDSDDMLTSGMSTIMNGERTKSTGGWSGSWSRIRSINIFFDNYKKCQGSFDSYKQYLGEALFFRASFWFDLVKTYGDVPWYSHTLTPDDQEGLYSARDSRTLVVDSILADLNKAAIYLPKRSVSGNCRLNQETALALITRVALNEGTWQKYHASDAFGTKGANQNKYFQACVTAAEELINGTGYTKGIYSTGKPNTDFYDMFGLKNMNSINEILFYKAFNKSEGFGNTVEGYISFNTSGKGATWWLVSDYLAKDGKPYDYLGLAQTTKGNAFLTKIANDCDNRLKFTIYIPGDLLSLKSGATFDKPGVNAGALQLCPTGFQVKKTSNPADEGANQTWEIGSETGYIYFRYGEVLLNYAEAKCELDGSVPYQQLNLLRARVGMPDFTVNAQSSNFDLKDYGYAISDALYEIRRERRAELALEGFRDQDYLRWAAHKLFKGQRPKGYPLSTAEFPTYSGSLDSNGLIDYYKTTLPNGYQFKEGRDYLNSIPQDEITMNPKLVQNPGWD